MKASPYIWNISGRVIQQALSYINTIVLAHYLSPEDFGKVGVLAIYTALATVLADTGMGGSLIKEKNLTERDCSTVFVYNLVLSLILYCTFFICSPFLETYFRIDGLTQIARFVAIPFVINALAIVPRSLCTKKLEFNKIFWISLISTIIAMASAIVSAWKGAGVWALIVYSIVNASVDNILYFIVCHYTPRLSFSVSSFKKLFSFGFFTALSVIVDTIYENILSVLLGRNVGEREVGYYSQAKKLEEAPSATLSITVSSVAFPILVTISSEDSFVAKCKSIQNTLMSISMPILFVLSVFSKPIMSFLLGSQWMAAAPYLSILCFAGLFRVLENTNRSFIKSKGRADIIFWLALGKRSIGIAILLFSMKFGMFFLLWAYVLTSFLCAFANSIAVARITGYSIKEQLLNWGQLAVAGFLYYLMLWGIGLTSTTWYYSILLIIVASIAYLLVLQIVGIKDLNIVLMNYYKRFIVYVSNRSAE